MMAGYRKFLTEEDLWALPVSLLTGFSPSSPPPACLTEFLVRPAQPDDTAYALGQRLEKAWQARRAQAVEKADAQPTIPGQQPSYAVAPADGRKATKEEKAKRPSLTGALVSAYGGPFFTAALFKVRFRPLLEVARVCILTPALVTSFSSGKTRSRSCSRGC